MLNESQKLLIPGRGTGNEAVEVDLETNICVLLSSSLRHTLHLVSCSSG